MASSPCGGAPRIATASALRLAASRRSASSSASERRTTGGMSRPNAARARASATSGAICRSATEASAAAKTASPRSWAKAAPATPSNRASVAKPAPVYPCPISSTAACRSSGAGAGRLAVGDQHRDRLLVVPVLPLDRPDDVARGPRGDRLAVEARDRPRRLGRLRLRAPEAHALDLHQPPQPVPVVAERPIAEIDARDIAERLAAQEGQQLGPEAERRVGAPPLPIRERGERDLGGREIAPPDSVAGGGQQGLARGRRRHRRAHQVRHPGTAARGGARAPGGRGDQGQRGDRGAPLVKDRARPHGPPTKPPTLSVGAVPNTVT